MTGKDSELEKIINGCLQNDRVSQRQLYDKYSSRMFAVCRRYANSDEEAEDMLMVGFMNVFKGLKSYSWDGAFFTWLTGVMMRTAISYYRSTKRFRNELPMGDEWDNEDVLLAEENIVTNLEAKSIIELMDQMPDFSRVVFNMKEIEGYKLVEIAQMLDKKEGTIRVAYMRARKWLADRLLR